MIFTTINRFTTLMNYSARVKIIIHDLSQIKNHQGKMTQKRGKMIYHR